MSRVARHLFMEFKDVFVYLFVTLNVLFSCYVAWAITKCLLQKRVWIVFIIVVTVIGQQVKEKRGR